MCAMTVSHVPHISESRHTYQRGISKVPCAFKSSSSFCTHTHTITYTHTHTHTHTYMCTRRHVPARIHAHTCSNDIWTTWSPIEIEYHILQKRALCFWTINNQKETAINKLPYLTSFMQKGAHFLLALLGSFANQTTLSRLLLDWLPNYHGIVGGKTPFW